MRRQSLVVLAAFLFAGSASAAPTDFTGTISIFIGTLPAIDSAEVTGVADFTDPTNFSLEGGTFVVQTTVPITDPSVMGTIPSLRATFTNGPGTFVGGTGPMPINGQSLVCLFVPGCSVNVTVPFNDGTKAFGVGGTIVVDGGAVNVTLARLGPWTTGTAQASGPTVMGGLAEPTRMGNVDGNTVTLVTPISILTSLTTSFPFLPAFGELTIEFAPEPGSAALFAGVLVGLFAVGRRRRQA